ncbi:MAG: DUF3021 domain-containing protein [Lachnospiraceae bacterium]|nr:DUF3021 domain-containing protein [Lachnospiraceae bacterium]
MKKYVKEFVHRGLLAAWGGPVIIAIIYLCLQANGVKTMMTVNEVVLGIISSAILAFIAAGVNVIYQIEELPLMWATFIQAIVLYFDYLIIYLINNWMKAEPIVILIFTLCFMAGYTIVWTGIYFLAIRPSINKMNRKLQEEA